MPGIYELDLANLFLGDDDPNEGYYLTMKQVTLPDLTETTKDFSPGGGLMNVAIGMRKIEPMTVPFQLEGINPEALEKFMPANPSRINYTIRGNLRDLKNHTDIPLVAVVEGRMRKATVGQFQSGTAPDSDYEIGEIMKYILKIDNVEKLYFDFWSGPAGVRINGERIYQQVAANLGIAL